MSSSPLTFEEQVIPPWGLELSDDDIHLWSASLERSAEQIQELSTLLDATEQQRAARFVFEHSRRRFIVARGLLRRLLGAYTGVAPEQLEFAYGEKGKPRLVAQPIAFNLSHSEELMLVGFARVPLGVDVEYLREISDAEAISQRFFSTNETVTLLRLDKTQRGRAFLLGWTRKEAYIKAIGRGLSYPLNRFEVTLDPAQEPKIVSLDGDTRGAALWRLVHVEPAPGYVGALAVSGQDWQIHSHRLVDDLRPSP